MRDIYFDEERNKGGKRTMLHALKAVVPESNMALRIVRPA